MSPRLVSITPPLAIVSSASGVLIYSESLPQCCGTQSCKVSSNLPPNRILFCETNSGLHNAQLLRRCAPFLIATLWKTFRKLPQRIATYHDVAERQHNVVHAFCSRSATCLATLYYIVPRCSHVVLCCYQIVVLFGETQSKCEHVQN